MATRRPPAAATARRTLAQTSSMVSSTSTSSSTSSASVAARQQQQQHHARQPSTEATQAAKAAIGAANKQPRMSYRPRDAEGNINVVVRCRARSTQETNSGTALTTAVKSLRGTAVTLTNPALAPPPTALSTAAPISRTYDFGSRPQEGKEGLGNVFGPDADQVMIYNDVARPILDEVLRGYNCTIFAYGQTGTGKTYTMEGDLSLARGISTSAGIIPRTLYSLFAKLAEDKSDFSVRCSFVELYNEELRDLNALDYSEPGFNAVPDTKQGPGSSAPSLASSGLRIYDDKVTGSGVIIQGLEETLITSAEDGLRVLKRGSERRQSASTNCNEHSSRSHSIFTITIHIKEPSKTGGEDLLKVGKLNLVDLAGSENIGRSGAVQGRAREAGMINTSLLTLGRVINKLVEKQSHIPYRESKLTRLLQDSLGGRTKTTIIATISPVNFDETASTLDYALRAKKIENRPEINQRMTKNVLLGQYATEIERLKQDLVCAREKNGIFISSESWTEMNADQDVRRAQLEETKRLLEVNDAQLATARDQFEQAMRMLGTREEELVRANQAIQAHQDEIRRTFVQLEGVQARLEQETALREAFETSRKAWQSTAGDAISDVAGLRAKIARKASVERSNLRTLETASSAISSLASNLTSQLDIFRQEQVQKVAQRHSALAALDQHQQAEVQAFSAEVQAQIASIRSRREAATGDLDALHSHITSFEDIVEAKSSALMEELSRKASLLASEQRKAMGSIVSRLTSHAEQTAQAMLTIVEPVLATQTRISELLQQNKQAIAELETREEACLKDENARLRNTVVELKAELDRERCRSEVEDGELVALLQSRLKDRSSQRAERMDKAAASVAFTVESESTKKVADFEQRRETLQRLRSQEDGVVESVNAGVSSVAKQAEADREVCLMSRSSQQPLMLALRSRFRKAFRAFWRNWNRTKTMRKAQSLHESRSSIPHAGKWVSRAFNRTAETQTQVLGAINDMVSLAESGADRIESHIHSMSTGIQIGASSLRLTLDGMAQSENSLVTETVQQLVDLKGHVDVYLSKDIKIDVSTGQTPRKRVWPGDLLAPVVDLDSSSRTLVVEKLLSAKEVYGGLDQALALSEIDSNGFAPESNDTFAENNDSVDDTTSDSTPCNDDDDDALDLQTRAADAEYASPTPPSARSLTPIEIETNASVDAAKLVPLIKKSSLDSIVALDERDHNSKPGTRVARMR
ncbi:Kinesin- motor protein [Microbotryomycetes sp. JL201]|nr:Kinesin- motor protein [Microbotryomycetes sp. JL201]